MAQKPCGRRRGTQTAAAGPTPAAGWALPREKNRRPAAVSGAPAPPRLPACSAQNPSPQPLCVVLGQFPSLRRSRIVLDSVIGTWLAPALPHPAHPGWLAGTLCRREAPMSTGDRALFPEPRGLCGQRSGGGARLWGTPKKASQGLPLSGSPPRPLCSPHPGTDHMSLQLPLSCLSPTPNRVQGEGSAPSCSLSRLGTSRCSINTGWTDE